MPYSLHLENSDRAVAVYMELGSGLVLVTREGPPWLGRRGGKFLSFEGSTLPEMMS